MSEHILSYCSRCDVTVQAHIVMLVLIMRGSMGGAGRALVEREGDMLFVGCLILCQGGRIKLAGSSGILREQGPGPDRRTLWRLT